THGPISCADGGSRAPRWREHGAGGTGRRDGDPRRGPVDAGGAPPAAPPAIPRGPRPRTDPDHRRWPEVLSFLPGNVPAHPMPAWVWQESMLVSAATLLRRIHDATVDVDRAGPWRSPVHEPAE